LNWEVDVRLFFTAVTRFYGYHLSRKIDSLLSVLNSFPLCFLQFANFNCLLPLIYTRLYYNTVSTRSYTICIVLVAMHICCLYPRFSSFMAILILGFAPLWGSYIQTKFGLLLSNATLNIERFRKVTAFVDHLRSSAGRYAINTREWLLGGRTDCPILLLNWPLLGGSVYVCSSMRLSTTLLQYRSIRVSIHISNIQLTTAGSPPFLGSHVLLSSFPFWNVLYILNRHRKLIFVEKLRVLIWHT